MNEKFEKMNSCGKQSDEHKEYFCQGRVVVDVSILLEMFKNCGHMCSKSGGEKLAIKGGMIDILWARADGHTDHCTSSHILCEKKGQKVFVNTLLMASSILITGNNFEKVKDLFKFLGIGFLSASTFHRIQRNYVVPEISLTWEEMKREIWLVLGKEALILCGDGRSDSPGHSAKYGTYLWSSS